MGKPKHPVGRFARVTLVDRGVDVVQRWWPIMTAAFTGLLTLYAKLGSFFAGFSWLDALVLGLFGGTVLTCLMLWTVVGYRRLRPPILPTHDRQDFVDEVVRLADLVGAQEPAIYNKKFTRCVIEGPGLLSIHDHVEYIFCSIGRGEELVTANVGAPLPGNIMMIRCQLDRCHFHNMTIVGSPDTMAKMRPNIEIISRSQWEAMRWATK